MELKDRVAIVTGAARNIGRGIALALAKEGVNVVVADVGGRSIKYAPRYKLSGMAELNRVAEEIKDLGVKSLPVKVDVTQAKEVQEMVRKTLEEFGTIDILVNNAGIIRMASVIDLTEEEWDAMFAVNVKGVYLCCKAVVPHMIEKKSGRIVNIGSAAGKQGALLAQGYCASKFANIGFTKALAIELAPHNITVNNVNPGALMTAMEVEFRAYAPLMGVKPEEVLDTIAKQQIPLGRIQKPEEIGDAVVFLCKADNITAQEVTVAGGMVQS